MKNVKKICLAGVLFSGLALAENEPDIAGGDVTLDVVTTGALLNVAGAGDSAESTAKQSVASILYGKVNGKLTSKVNVKGAILNVGGAYSGAKAMACQSVGSVGSDCAKGASGE